MLSFVNRQKTKKISPKKGILPIHVPTCYKILLQDASLCAIEFFVTCLLPCNYDLKTTKPVLYSRHVTGRHFGLPDSKIFIYGGNHGNET